MEQALIIVFTLVVVALIGLVMIQQGRGADAGASFGSGASQTVFGSSGNGNFLTRTTSILAVAFFAASLGLAYVAKQKTLVVDENVPVIDEVPVLIEEAKESDTPELPQ